MAQQVKDLLSDEPSAALLWAVGLGVRDCELSESGPLVLVPINKCNLAQDD